MTTENEPNTPQKVVPIRTPSPPALADRDDGWWAWAWSLMTPEQRAQARSRRITQQSFSDALASAGLSAKKAARVAEALALAVSDLEYFANRTTSPDATVVRLQDWGPEAAEFRAACAISAATLKSLVEQSR